MKSHSFAVDCFDHILQIEKQAERNVERLPAVTLEDHNEDLEIQRE